MTRDPEDTLTWPMLIAAPRTGQGSTARYEVGEWAIEQVHEALGEDWPQRWLARFGRPPAFIADAATDAAAYALLIETGLRLKTLARTPGIRKLAREWSADLEQNRFLHVRMQLGVAALAQARGAQVEFETKLPGFARPTDVVITAGSERLVAECFSIYNDVATAEGLAYDRDLGLQLYMRTLDVRLSGHWDVRLPPEQAAELLAEVENVAAQVSADGLERSVTRPGVEFHIATWSAPTGSGVAVEGPTTTAAGWRRAGGIISDKAARWGDAPLPVWLRFDLLDGTALFSDWAQQPLPGRTERMAALVAQAVGSANVAGVVVSCGARLDARAAAEDYMGARGIIGLQHRVDFLRIRETFVVPLSPIGARHAQLWRDLYDGESQWLLDALRAASVRALTLRSAPCPRGTSCRDSDRATATASPHILRRATSRVLHREHRRRPGVPHRHLWSPTLGHRDRPPVGL